MKIALLQLNFTVGDFAGNAAKILDAYTKACANGADLVATTELALFGYPPLDLLERRDYLNAQAETFAGLCSRVGSVPLIIGMALARDTARGGKPLHNSAVAVQNGKVIFSRNKALLPVYDVFDESRYFEPNDKPYAPLIVGGKRIAILVCEDIWGGTEDPGGRKLYAKDPVHEMRGEGRRPDVLIVINGSPYYWGKGAARLALVSELAKNLGVPVVYANQIGANTDLVFDGQSFAVDKSGACIAQGKAFAEDIVTVDLENPRTLTPTSDAGDPVFLYDALTLSVRDYQAKTGNTKGVVIGLSGGIDSALTARIAVDALEKEKVLGIAMPSPYSSPESIEDARELAKNLGIAFQIVPIAQGYASYGEMLKSAIGWQEPGSREGDVTEENVQARIRGNILMAISNRTGRMVLATGNKSEIATGFCTLYGDMAGGYAVLSDVPKTDVYRLAKYANEKRPESGLIPERTITKPPSAELRPDQRDDQSLPPYDVLDAILHAYVEEQKTAEEIIASGIAEEDVRRTIRLMNKSEFKRRQMAPGPKVTGKAFGSGRRIPIAAKFLG